MLLNQLVDVSSKASTAIVDMGVESISTLALSLFESGAGVRSIPANQGLFTATFAFDALSCLNAGTSKLRIGGLASSTSFAVRVVVSNMAGLSNGSIAVGTTLDDGIAVAVLEFDAEFGAVFGQSALLSGLSQPLTTNKTCSHSHLLQPRLPLVRPSSAPSSFLASTSMQSST